MYELSNAVIQEFKDAIGREYVKTTIEDEDTFTHLAATRKIGAILYPASTEEVQAIVRIANAHMIPLYPISKGKNLGYGEKLPVTEGNVVVDLSRMNNILEFDKTNGFIKIQPGVTQEQLSEACKGTEFFSDVTGSVKDSSVIGNSVDGGFGLSPKGNKPKYVTNIEFVSGKGEVIDTKDRFVLGPDLTGLATQSNFGIVTAATIELNRNPEAYESFMLEFEKEKLPEVVEALSKLREYTIGSGRIFNATRICMSAYDVPEELKKQFITLETAREIISSPGRKAGHYTAAGAIYGFKEEAEGKKKTVERFLSTLGELSFFDDEKIADLMEQTKGQAVGLKIFHTLMKGESSDIPYESMLKWRVKKPEHAGFIWYAPYIKFDAEHVQKVIEVTEEVFHKDRFEMPISINAVEPHTAVCVTTIDFDLTDPERTKQAHACYHELDKRLKEAGIFPYRTSILGMEGDHYDTSRKMILSNLKKLFDPNNIVAPGRYGISP